MLELKLVLVQKLFKPESLHSSWCSKNPCIWDIKILVVSSMERTILRKFYSNRRVSVLNGTLIREEHQLQNVCESIG